MLAPWPEIDPSELGLIWPTNMITERIVLILGAGASVEYGFPTGRRLLLDICRPGFLRETEAPTIFSKTTWKRIWQATRPRLDQTRDPQLIIEQAEQAQNQDSPFGLIYLANRNGAPGRVEHDNRSPATRVSLLRRYAEMANGG